MIVPTTASVIFAVIIIPIMIIVVIPIMIFIIISLVGRVEILVLIAIFYISQHFVLQPVRQAHASRRVCSGSTTCATRTEAHAAAGLAETVTADNRRGAHACGGHALADGSGGRTVGGRSRHVENVRAGSRIRECEPMTSGSNGVRTRRR